VTVTRANRRRTPRATYRVQLHPDNTFDDVGALVPVLVELGISHLYLSPCLEAVEGSTHGYDVIDPTRIRAALGGEDGLSSLAGTAHAAGLGLILDIVPNHVGLASPANPWWWDVLAHGPDGRYGRHLDIHWRDGAHGQPTLLLPELGRSLEEELAGDDLQLAHVGSDDPRPGWRIVYHHHAWPVRTGSLAAVGLDDLDVDGTLAAVAADRRRLADLLDRQHYRLAYWRRANDELDHRRFFDVSTLGAVRVEDPTVFADVHAAVLPRVADGTFDGLRIDHPDGLKDPVGYFHRLRDAVGEDVWIVVEKILEAGERLRQDWPVDGTVGYRFADLMLGLHVDPAAGEILDDLQARLTDRPIDRSELIDQAKRAALTSLFGTERRRLRQLLLDALDGITDADAGGVIDELVVAWPVYRTYVRPDDDAITDEDAEVISHAVARVRARGTVADDLLDRVAATLRLEHRSDAADAFVWAFQQLTGPAIAKGVEDTVLYRDLRFVAVNEVGSDPQRLGRSVGELHASNATTQAHKPTTMLLSSTHDTKRSEDVRARLACLSQDPDHWVRTVLRWRTLTAPLRGTHGPTPAHEHLAYQTIVGAWPIDGDRLSDYLRKAAREGKDATNWLEPNEAYEADLEAFARSLVDDERMRDEIDQVVERFRDPGWLTSLSMVALKLTSPGVPDIYQGCELWDLSLVDPDNRRPVDHDVRAHLLASLRGGVDPSELMADLDDGRAKLWTIRQALSLRAERPSAFGAGSDYLPLWATGHRAANVAAYVRGGQVATIAPVQVLRIGPRFAAWDWQDTTVTLPAGRWHDRLSGAEHDGGAVAVADLLRRFPVSLLSREERP
jgi:(1->4)-alpha-D-glucan 1-alpha-D-glucosylmutase